MICSLFTTTHPTYDTVSACIRLGHKYQIDYVVQQALDYLRRYYPSDFDALEQIDGAPAPKFTFTHAIGVVNLARLTGTHSLLPTALALCCSLKAHQLVEGFRRADGTHEVLSSSDLALCFQVNRALIREHVALVFHVFTPERAPGCTGGGKRCLEGMRTLLSEHGERVHSFTTPLPYAKWDYVKDIHRTSVCPSCLLLLKKRELDRRRDIWNRLPALCGVGVPA